jgi:hypothetical protein
VIKSAEDSFFEEEKKDTFNIFGLFLILKHVGGCRIGWSLSNFEIGKTLLGMSFVCKQWLSFKLEYLNKILIDEKRKLNCY